jgi:hypothetical protein
MKVDGAMLGPGFTNLESLPARAREMVVSRPEEVAALASYSAVSGHLRLSTLLQLTPSESIGTILREPRARLLSQYVYWRTQPGEGAPQFQPREYALRPLDVFLSEAAVAHANDNLVCRMLLDPDPRLPIRDFIASSDVEAIASDAAAKVDALGFVGLLELGDAAWQGLSRLFGVALAPDRQNVTARRRLRPDAEPLAHPATARTIELLEARTRADALVYEHVLAAAGHGAEARAWLSDAAFANQLVQLGDTAGHSATWLAKLEDHLEADK